MRLTIKDKKAFSTYLMRFYERYTRAMELTLSAYIEELSTHAKNNAGYEDQTGNLKASIGGVLLYNGKPITYKGFQGKPEGVTQGQLFIKEVSEQYPQGFVIIMVAGMEYGAYVEDISNKNVLTQSELKMNRELGGILNNLVNKLEKANV